MKTLLPLAIMIVALATARAAVPTQSNSLEVSLLPGTNYEAQATISTSAVSSLLSLLAEGQSPLRILDEAGNLLGELSAADLAELLQGLTGSVVKVVTIPLDNTTSTMDRVVVETLDTPFVEVSNLTVSRAERDRRPKVTIKRMIQRQKKVVLRGTATDDHAVARVEVKINQRLKVARGKGNWHLKVKLQKGRNRIVVRAFDNASQVSPKKQTFATRK